MRATALPPIFALLVLAAALAAPGKLLGDPDTYWHIAAGQWMLAHGAVPRADPFSFSVPGAPWVAHEWLSELGLALAWRAGGWGGVVLLAAAAAAVAMSNLVRHLGRVLAPLPVLVLALLATATLAPVLLARPHILALPAMEAFVAGLLAARAASRAPSPALLGVMALWANLHGGFVLGLALVPPLALEAALAAAPVARARVVRDWGVFCAGAVLAGCLTPQTWHGLVFPFHLLAMHTALGAIGEWRSPDFGQMQPVEIWLLAALGLAGMRSVRLPPIRLALLLGLVHLGLAHGRDGVLVGMIGPLLAAEALARSREQQEAFAVTHASCSRPLSDRVIQTGGGRAQAIGLGAGIALASLWLLAHPVRRGTEAISPQAALAHLPPGLAQAPVFNDYDFGGYLIFAGIRPFIDGRADLYGDRFMDTYLRAMHPDRATLVALLDRYAVTWTLLRPGDGAVPLLDAMPGWRRLYSDETAIVHVRPDARAALEPPAPAL